MREAALLFLALVALPLQANGQRSPLYSNPDGAPDYPFQAQFDSVVAVHRAEQEAAGIVRQFPTDDPCDDQSMMSIPHLYGISAAGDTVETKDYVRAWASKLPEGPLLLVQLTFDWTGRIQKAHLVRGPEQVEDEVGWATFAEGLRAEPYRCRGTPRPGGYRLSLPLRRNAD